jgi:hypothetical protein
MLRDANGDPGALFTPTRVGAPLGGSCDRASLTLTSLTLNGGIVAPGRQKRFGGHELLAAQVARCGRPCSLRAQSVLAA